jgi:dihydroorotate dehydrogenase
LFDVVDYFVVNVSSPNTPGLRELQEKEPLMNAEHFTATQ